MSPLAVFPGEPVTDPAEGDLTATNPRVTTYTWNHDGTLARIDRPNGTHRAITYDTAGRPQSIEERTSANGLINSYDLGYFDSDEVKTLTPLPEITADPIESPASLNLTYDADNRLDTYHRPYVDAPQNVVHDPDGNMTHGPAVDGEPATYSYDARNRLTNAGGLSYSYNAEDIRTQVTGNGDTITYVTDPHGDLSKVLQRTKNGKNTRYVYGVGLLYEVDGGGNATYYHFDQVGNTAALTNEGQGVIARYRYSPYGIETHREGTHDTPFRFGGFYGIQTDANGLIHMRARYYHPLIRRFINADPARAGWNWYAYANGNPVNFIDPSGEAPIAPLVIPPLLYFGSAPFANAPGPDDPTFAGNPAFDETLAVASIGTGVGPTVSLGRTVVGSTISSGRSFMGTLTGPATNAVGSQGARIGGLGTMTAEQGFIATGSLARTTASTASNATLSASRNLGARIITNYGGFSASTGTAGFLTGSLTPLEPSDANISPNPITAPFQVGNLLGGIATSQIPSFDNPFKSGPSGLK